MRFTYLGRGYQFLGGHICPSHWHQFNGKLVYIEAGHISFTIEQTETIKLWFKNEGYAGLTLEEFVELMVQDV